MRLIEINLASRPFRNNTLYWTGFGSAALGLTALTCVNLWLFLGYGTTMSRHRRDLEMKLGKREQLLREEQRLSAKLNKLDFRGLAQQAEFANTAIRRRVFSWTELFNRLEEVVPPTVMMTSIRPEIQPDGISIVVEGVAKDHEGLLDFEENLIRDAFFARIYPGSERREQRDRELRFSLKFDYVPAGRPGVPANSPSRPNEPSTERPPREAATSVAATPPSPEGAPSATPAAGVANPPGSPGPTPPRQISTGPTPTPQPASSGAIAAPGTPTAPSKAAPRQGAGPRALLKPGALGKRGLLGRSGREPLEGEAGRRERFLNVPIQEVFDVLMRERNMTFVSGGEFDLRQRVSFDFTRQDEMEMLAAIAKAMDCLISRESPGVYRLSQRPTAPLEEPPLEEEPVPEPPPEDPPEATP